MFLLCLLMGGLLYVGVCKWCGGLWMDGCVWVCNRVEAWSLEDADGWRVSYRWEDGVIIVGFLCAVVTIVVSLLIVLLPCVIFDRMGYGI